MIVGDLIAADLAEAEIAGFGMGEVEAAHAGAGPHRIRLRDQHAGVCLHVEQAPEGALLRVVGARRVTGRRPDPAILLMDKVLVAQAFLATVTPLLAHSL